MDAAVSRPAAFERQRDAAVRAFYAQCLRDVVAQFDEAEDGREALVKTVINRPELLVTDAQLSGFSGYDLCDALRAHHATADIPIVVVTANNEPATVARAQDAGADAIIAKPCSPELLLQEVRRLINRSRELRRNAQQIRVRAATQLAKSDRLQERAREHRSRRALSKSFVRYGTSRPPSDPPALLCPHCGHRLVYERSHVGGVSEKQLEQWDYFDCEGGCGNFQFRHRTRRVRKML